MRNSTATPFICFSTLLITPGPVRDGDQLRFMPLSVLVPATGRFGHGWADIDGDCQNSRHEALIAQSTASVRYKDGGQCQVTAGRWISPFTGTVIHDPREMDIDHVVPLKWAWEYGANRWSGEKREQFANDPINLLSVEARLNRQKGAKGPDEWLPPANRCQYMLRFLRVAKIYRLATPGHYQQIRQQLCN